MIVEEALEISLDKSSVIDSACCGCSITSPWFLVVIVILRWSSTAGRGARFLPSAMARRLADGPSGV